MSQPLSSEKRFIESERVLRKCVEILESNGAIDLPQVVMDLALLGLSVKKLGRYEEAEYFYPGAVRLQDKQTEAGLPVNPIGHMGLVVVYCHRIDSLKGTSR